MHTVKLLCMLALLTIGQPGKSLVSPGIADITHKDWLVTIYLQGNVSQKLYLFCMGSIIDESWILTSSFCFDDTFRSRRNVSTQEDFEYIAITSRTKSTLEIDDFEFSSDGPFALFRLSSPTDIEPIPMNFSTPSELVGETVKIYNYLESAGIGHAFLNPLSTRNATCNIDGVDFFNNGYICYVLGPIYNSFFFRELNGTVLDPNTDEIPDLPIHENSGPFSSYPLFLYLDTSSSDAYACYEDIGAPIIANIDDELVQVGIVAATGYLSGVPFCNSSFYNFFASVYALENFVSESETQILFDQSCPRRPNLQFERLGETEVRFYWNDITGADGYRVLFTTQEGYIPIESADIGNLTEATANLEPGVSYGISILAYNETCTGQPSTPRTVLLELLDIEN